MKVKQICMMVLLWLGVIPAVQAQTFDKLWIFHPPRKCSKHIRGG